MRETNFGTLAETGRKKIGDTMRDVIDVIRGRKWGSVGETGQKSRGQWIKTAGKKLEVVDETGQNIGGSGLTRGQKIGDSG